MKCKKMHKFLPGYLAGETSGPDEDAVVRHLERCAACRAEFEELGADIELMAAVDAPDLSPFVVTRVMAEVRADGTQPELRRRLVFGRVLATAATVVLVALGTWVGAVLGAGLVGSDSGSGDEFQQLLTVESEQTLDEYFSSMLGER